MHDKAPDSSMSMCPSWPWQKTELHLGGLTKQVFVKELLILKTKRTNNGCRSILYCQDSWAKRGNWGDRVTTWSQWELDFMEEGQTDRSVTGTAGRKEGQGDKYPAAL